MGKTLLIVVLGIVIWWMWRRLRAVKPDAPPNAAGRAPETMVCCALCGVNQPRSECVAGADDGVFYCSDAHRRDAEARAGRG